MPDLTDPAVSVLEDAARALVSGRDVIVFNPTVRGTEGFIEDLRAFGARRVCVIAGTEGTGPALDPRVHRVIVPAPARSMTEEILAEEVVVQRMTAAHCRVVDEFDPSGRALVLGSPFTSASVLGTRPIVGHRSAAWADLEDKVTIDGVLGAAGVPTPPHEITEPAGAAGAASRLDAGSGVVVAAGGRNGGGEFVRWVADPAAATPVAAELTGAPPRRARGSGLGRVRVAPFVEGVPTSMGGFVADDGVAVLRPVENLTLRRGRQLLYCGVSTLYDPPAEVRAAMTDAVRRVGEELRQRIDLRGGFSVDGIVSADGWVATEVNVRLSGSFATTAGAAAPISGKLVQAVLCSGRDDLSLPAAVIESALLPSAESHRLLRVLRVLPGGPTGPEELTFRVEGRRAIPTDEPEEGCGELRLGESALGGLVAGAVQSSGDGALDVGPPGAPLAVSLLDLADERWGTGTGGLHPAHEVGASGALS